MPLTFAIPASLSVQSRELAQTLIHRVTRLEGSRMAKLMADPNALDSTSEITAAYGQLRLLGVTFKMPKETALTVNGKLPIIPAKN
jgi:hypothetical protein